MHICAQSNKLRIYKNLKYNIIKYGLYFLIILELVYVMIYKKRSKRSKELNSIKNLCI